MNLIQIKQIDGLQDALNSLSSSVYNLDQDVQSEFEGYDNFWSQLYWNTDKIEINSNGDTSNGREDISLNISNGGLRVYSDSYFEDNLYVNASLNVANAISGNNLTCDGFADIGGNLGVSGDFNATASAGQIKYINPDGDAVSLVNPLQPSYLAVVTSATSLDSDSYIAGVRPNTIASDSTITLPAPSASKQIIVKDEQFNSSTHNIKVIPNGSEQIEGQVSLTITGDGGFASVYSDGNNWFMLNASGVSLG